MGRAYTYGADYILEILGQKWGALPNFLALRNHQKCSTWNNNQVSLMIGQILRTAAENTGWLTRSILCKLNLEEPYIIFEFGDSS